MGLWLQEWPQLPLESERLNLPPVVALTISQRGICIDEQSEKVYVDGQLVKTRLPNLQYRALLHLARNAGRVISRDEMYDALHSEGEVYLPTDQSLDALIYRLRVALGDKEQRYLKTVRKRGHLLTQATIIPRH